MSDYSLKGKVIGFEEYENYTLEAAFGESSPFRALSCLEEPISFVVVDPYYIMADYSFEIEDSLFKNLFGESDCTREIAILCLVRPDNENLRVNLRSPLVINTKKGTFVQTILQSDTYGVSVPFAVRKAPDGTNE